MKHFRLPARLLALLLCMLLVIGLFPVQAAPPAPAGNFSGGTGTASDPYQIRTPAELRNVASDLSAHYSLEADLVFMDSDFAEGGMFYNNGQLWIPLGRHPETPFTGTFRGNGHTITGLRIALISQDSLSRDNAVYGGLFGCNQGEISGIHLADSHILLSPKQLGGSPAQTSLGFLVGSNFGGSIADCSAGGTIDGEIRIAFNLTDVAVGGLVGRSEGGSIRNCVFTDCLDVFVRGHSPAMGCIVGYCYNGAVVSDCYSDGSLEGNVGNSGLNMIGGIVGQLDRSFALNCTNRTDLIGWQIVGGVVGRNDAGVVQYCENHAETIRTSQTAGGITGYSGDGAIVADCVNTGYVYDPPMYIGKGGSVGGICGNTGSWAALVRCGNTGFVSGDMTAGGILGAGYGCVLSCYNAGDVQSTYYLAGICGTFTGTIENCYNVGNLNCAREATRYRPAGIVSNLDGCARNVFHTGSLIANGETSGQYAGIVYDAPTEPDTMMIVENAYYIDSAEFADFAGDISAAALSAAEFARQDSYAGFDFDKVWAMGDTHAQLMHNWQSGDCPVETEPFPTPEILNPFTDIHFQQYYYLPVFWAYYNGITTGVTEDTFQPDGNCTRGQVVTFLWRAMGEPEPASGKMPFVDVSADAYYYKAVLWAYEQGITTGVDATRFAPEQKVSRGQFVTFLWRTEGKPASSGSNPFVDVRHGEYYTQAVLWAFEQGITTGMSATTFSPNLNCTRGQIVTFLYRNAQPA